MLKMIVKGIAGLVVIGLIVPMFLSSHFSMSRSIEIEAPLPTVFSKLTSLSEYNKWNPFPEGDPSNQTTVTGEGVGSSLSWTGKKTGEGKMTVTNIEPNQKIDVKMEFFKPMTGEGVVHWLTREKSASVTELTWSFEQDLSYFNRYFGLMMDAMMGKHFEKGLLNFKTLVESEQKK